MVTDQYTLEEILEYFDIDTEELIEHLISIGWIDKEAIPVELEF